jgi:hypothetical protein
VKARAKPEQFNFIETLSSKSFGVASVLVGVTLVGAHFTNHAHTNIPGRHILYSSSNDVLANTFNAACIMLGFVGFKFPSGTPFHERIRNVWRRVRSAAPAAIRHVGFGVSTTLLLGFLVGFTPLLHLSARIWNGIDDLCFIIGLEFAEAFLWHLGRRCVLRMLRHG